jgi:hypothetical protein
MPEMGKEVSRSIQGLKAQEWVKKNSADSRETRASDLAPRGNFAMSVYLLYMRDLDWERKYPIWLK